MYLMQVSVGDEQIQKKSPIILLGFSTLSILQRQKDMVAKHYQYHAPGHNLILSSDKVVCIVCISKLIHSN